MNTEEITKVLNALETGLDAAHEVAYRFHYEMNGYREAEHKQVDEDVSVIEEAIKIVKAERTTSPVSQMTDEQIMEIAAPYLRIDITDMSDEWLQDCRNKFIATVRAILAAAAEIGRAASANKEGSNG